MVALRAAPRRGRPDRVRRNASARPRVLACDYERGPGVLSPIGKCRSRMGPSRCPRRDHALLGRRSTVRRFADYSRRDCRGRSSKCAGDCRDAPLRQLVRLELGVRPGRGLEGGATETECGNRRRLSRVARSCRPLLRRVRLGRNRSAPQWSVPTVSPRSERETRV